ncbi:MAG: TolC family protein, partial [Planctomycetaceae bacterium]|nr:TolC family protein [Planctomycetaceae bacterium]
MKREFSIAVAAVVVFASGCATGPERHVSKSQDLKQSVDRVSALEEKPYRLTLEDNDEFVSAPRSSESKPRQVTTHEEDIALPVEQAESILLPAPEETLPATAREQQVAMSLKTLEQTALSNNPTLIQAMAQVDAATGAAYQAGLYPNPVVGYASDQIGIAGTAGELQGGYVSQEFVTGGKLQLSRAKWSQAACIAETNLSAQYDRVLNDVRIHFYKTLAAQQHVELQ